MTCKGREWRRAANVMARILWINGEKARAYNLMRESVKDAEKEGATL